MRTSTRPQRPGKVVLIALLLLLLLIGSGLGTFYWLSHTGPIKGPVTTTTNPLAGQAFFDSSGQSSENSSRGINDELQINLSSILAPTPGKSYFAWLLSDKNITPAISLLLGKLSITHGKVLLLYHGDQRHTNLLEAASRLLITEEDASSTPTSPSTDPQSWRYYAELPQTPDPKDTIHHFKILDYLRNLLSEDPTIKDLGIHGGLDIQLFRNTEKILEWAGSARDDWRGATSFTLMRNQFIRILDYLDGNAYVNVDVPSNTPPLVSALFPMLKPDLLATPNQASSDYVNEIIGQMNAIAQAPGGTPDKLTNIAQIKTGLKNVKNWFGQVHLDAVQLIKMTDAQLRSSATLSILDDMYTQAFYAYVGRLDPATNKVEPGVIQIHYDTEYLATFDIQSYKSS